MDKIQWDKLPIGTVLKWNDGEGLTQIEVKITKDTTMVVGEMDIESRDEAGYIYDYKDSGYYQRHAEVAPKWIQELFKIK